MKDVLIHMISDDDLMNELSVATKVVPSPYVMRMLKTAGWRAADDFLAAHLGKIGREGTVNLEEMFS